MWTAERTIRAGHRELVAVLPGVTPGDGDRWADAEELDTAYARYVDNLADQRGWRLSLAHAVAVCEANLRDIGRWNFRADLAVVWLDWLVESAGLGRAPVEEELRAEAEAALAPGPAGEGEGQARYGGVLDECPDCGEVECDACDGGPPVEDVHLPDAEDGQEGGQAA